MVKKVFTIYDKKAFVYGPPVCFGKVGEALRWFCDIIAEPQGTVGKYPDDFQLYELGEYDDNTGSILTALPHMVANASEYKTKAPVVYEPAATDPKEK